MDPFGQAAALLPPGLRTRALAAPEEVRARAEELRLRAGRRPTVTLGEREAPLPGEEPVTVRELELTLEIATQASVHAALEKVRQGWFTAPMGHRIGLCGSVDAEQGAVRALRGLSSVNIRIAHCVPGCGEEAFRALGGASGFSGALILAPPGWGKTTLLRDLVRLLSDGGRRVGLCDERGEVAGLWQGLPRFDVGERTDILEGCPKAQALLMLLRGMNPQILACDEITAKADLEALKQCANCGVKLLSTAHGTGLEDLERRPLYRELLEGGLFGSLVSIRREGAGFVYQTEALPC